jgi:hypothetical protein
VKAPDSSTSETAPPTGVGWRFGNLLLGVLLLSLAAGTCAALAAKTALPGRQVKVEKLLREHKDEVEQEKDSGSKAWYLLRSIKPGVRVRELCEQYKIETLRQYQHRSREQINTARTAGKKI